MLSIYKFSDYRTFLKYYYNAKKEQNKAFSFRFFARKAGLRSGNYLKLVMDGARSLTHKNIKNFAQGLGLAETEGLYFENLVFYNQAKTPEEQNFYKKNLKVLKEKGYGTVLTKEQYEVCTKWYYLVLKELILLKNFKNNPKWISDKLDKKLTPQEVRDALALLVQLGLLKEYDEKYLPTSKDLVSENGESPEAIKKYHKGMLEQASKALDTQTRDERYFNGLTVAINTKDLPAVFEKITQFRNSLDQYLTRKEILDAVYQLNIQFFRHDNKF